MNAKTRFGETKWLKETHWLQEEAQTSSQLGAVELNPDSRSSFPRGTKLYSRLPRLPLQMRRQTEF
jgi:hypothetical protein